MTELIWEGKYKVGPSGERVKQGPLRVALPFQTVETVNESAQERQKGLDLFASGGEGEWRNRLIWGDKKYVLPSLLEEFAGKVDLIYIDPPFDTGQDFSFRAKLPETEEEAEWKKEPSIIEQKAYRDTWGVSADERTRGMSSLDKYCSWFDATIALLYELLSDSGTIYVHLDFRVGHYAKCILDSYFTRDRLLNELIWFYPDSPGRPYDRFPPKHDLIFRYGKSDKFTFNAADIRVPILEASKKRYEKPRYLINSQGKRFEYVGGASAQDGKVPETVWQIPVVKGTTEEDVGYDTQKPERLLDRIILASSNHGDLVLDCFCGSGTTAASAERLGRRWITCDLGRFAIHTTRKRLLQAEGVKPFVVQNLGKYERQQWQVQEFGEDAEAKLRTYRAFILQLYHARELEGKTWLHGLKSGRMVHVGSVDSPISLGDVQQIAKEFKLSIGTGENAPTGSGVDVLGWDFAFDLNETAQDTARQAGIDMRFVVIPREVLEKKAVEQGDIHFYELAALSVETEVEKRKLNIELTDFIMSLEDVPQDVQQAVKHWSQWIDYWAVDFDFKGDTFHNQWQSYRTRKEPKLTLKTEHAYEKPGSYIVMVKVIDILGNDTTKTVKIEVK
jgi:adenine-specific DNA-methyltransferase